MPSSPECLTCKKPLILKNTRDIERKKFCSIACRNSHSLLNRFLKLKKKQCDVCGILFKPTNSCQRNCSSKCTNSLQTERSYKYLNGNKEGYIKHLLAKKARVNISLEYCLELYDLQNGKCALSGIKMTFIKKTDGIKIHTNLSIDRIDSSIGYEIGNIQLVCAITNIMKSTLSTTELQWWCGKIIDRSY